MHHKDGLPLTYGSTPGGLFILPLLLYDISGGQETGREMQDWGSNMRVGGI